MRGARLAFVAAGRLAGRDAPAKVPQAAPEVPLGRPPLQAKALLHPLQHLPAPPPLPARAWACSRSAVRAAAPGNHPVACAACKHPGAGHGSRGRGRPPRESNLRPALCRLCSPCLAVCRIPPSQSRRTMKRYRISWLAFSRAFRASFCMMPLPWVGSRGLNRAGRRTCGRGNSRGTTRGACCPPASAPPAFSLFLLSHESIL